MEIHIRDLATLLQKYAEIEVIKLEVLSMRTANKERELNGAALAYNDGNFQEKANDIIAISEYLRDFC